jgi:hypothetical protein
MVTILIRQFFVDRLADTDSDDVVTAAAARS